MKSFRRCLLIALFACGGGALSAQVLQNHAEPTVIFINKGNVVLDSLATQEAIDTYYQTMERGFRQMGLPRFIIAGREQKMILGIGGNVAVRTSYDFNGAVQSRDFVTSTIPVPNAAITNQQFRIDPSTSTLYFKAIAKAGRLGPIVGYINADFRGSDGTSFFLRDAYISIAGFTVGRQFTTFCDLTSLPSTVDWEGPNGAATVYATMIRYARTFGKHWKVAVAAELPSVSITASQGTESMAQRVPDFPLYGQYSWHNGLSHVRMSFVFRDMYYYNKMNDEVASKFGWGMKFSGEWAVARKLSLYWFGVYGQGIANYLQDISGDGMDLVPDTANPSRLQTMKMGAWSGGLQYTFNPKWVATAVYSGVKVAAPQNYCAQGSLYNLSHYVSANVFYNITPSCQTGLSYMYGSRKNINGDKGHANRVQAIIQYNF